MSFFSRSKKNASTDAPKTAPSANTPEPTPEAPAAPVEPEIPAAAPEVPEAPEVAEPSAEEAFVPEPEFKPAETAGETPADEAAADMSPEFYGSYGEACNNTAQPASEPAPEPPSEPSAEESTPDIDFSVLDFDLPDVTLPAAEETSAPEETEFNPILNFSDGGGDDDELVLPDIPAPAPSAPGEVKKSMGYETTVKLRDAHTAYGNQKPINEPIKSGEAIAAPKRRDYTVVASGTARVSGDLPKLREGEMYVAVTPKELRRLKSRRFRGLGVLATLCLVVIAAFCIWNYANSFADPLIGSWKGDMNSACLPIDQIQQLDQEMIQSTWEFSSSGSLYVNIVVNETPISLSGTYEEKKDSSGEPYLTMTITNPMDATDYVFDMYYTVTGQILELNDTEGMGMTIDLTKE